MMTASNEKMEETEYSGGGKRKRYGISKWDPGENGRSSIEAAAEAVQKVNALLVAKGKLKPSSVQSSSTYNRQSMTVVASSANLVVAEVEINDVAIKSRNILVKGATQEEISRASGAAVSTRGRYMTVAERHRSSERPLYLCVQGPHKDMVNAAVRRINDIIGNKIDEQGIIQRSNISLPPQPPLILSSSRSNLPLSLYEEKILVGLEHAPPAFDVEGRLRGPNNQYLEHIECETGAKVTLRGKGTGFSETLPGCVDAMHVHIVHGSTNDLQRAKDLAINLINTVQKDYAEFQTALALLTAPAILSQHASLSQQLLGNIQLDLQSCPGKGANFLLPGQQQKHHPQKAPSMVNMPGSFGSMNNVRPVARSRPSRFASMHSDCPVSGPGAEGFNMPVTLLAQELKAPLMSAGVFVQQLPPVSVSQPLVQLAQLGQPLGQLDSISTLQTDPTIIGVSNLSLDPMMHAPLPHLTQPGPIGPQAVLGSMGGPSAVHQGQHMQIMPPPPLELSGPVSQAHHHDVSMSASGGLPSVGQPIQQSLGLHVQQPTAPPGTVIPPSVLVPLENGVHSSLAPTNIGLSQGPLPICGPDSIICPSVVAVNAAGHWPITAPSDEVHHLHRLSLLAPPDHPHQHDAGGSTAEVQLVCSAGVGQVTEHKDSEKDFDKKCKNFKLNSHDTVTSKPMEPPDHPSEQEMQDVEMSKSTFASLQWSVSRFSFHQYSGQPQIYSQASDTVVTMPTSSRPVPLGQEFLPPPPPPMESLPPGAGAFGGIPPLTYSQPLVAPPMSHPMGMTPTSQPMREPPMSQPHPLPVHYVVPSSSASLPSESLSQQFVRHQLIPPPPPPPPTFAPAAGSSSFETHLYPTHSFVSSSQLPSYSQTAPPTQSWSS